MADLPSQGGSDGTWGTELNTWLQTEHNADASHNSSTFFDTLGTYLAIHNGEIMTHDGELVYLS